MSNLDSLLAFMRESGADELRLATGERPQMLARGTPQRLTIAATDEATFRFLLAGILTPEIETVLMAQRQVELMHDAGPLGTYQVGLRILSEPSGLAAVIRSCVEARGVRSQERSVGPAVPGFPKQTESRPVESRSAPAAETVSHRSVVDPVANDAIGALLRLASSLGASDLHLSQGEKPRARIDGAIRLLAEIPEQKIESWFLLDESAHVSLTKGISVEFTLADTSGGAARVHLYPTSDGIAAAIRLLPPHAPSLDSLHLPARLDDLIQLPHGLVLVCGASGSGKSTTVAALAQAALDRRSIVLVTLEDPIEYTLLARHSSVVRRRQIGRDVADLTMGLRDALRENPDLLLVGELRDAEAIQLAMTAAETGHLVLATLHSRSAASAITRLIDGYPPTQQEQARRQMAESLRAVVAQRLLPRATPPGRVPALEVLRVNQAASSLIREGKTSQLGTVMQSARGEGMLLLERCLADQVREGSITLQAARAAANDPASLALQLGTPATRP